MAGKPETMQEATSGKTPQEPPPQQKLKCSEDILDVDYSLSDVEWRTPTNLGPSSETSPKSTVEDFVRDLKVAMQEVICKTVSCNALSSSDKQETMCSPMAEETFSILSDVFKHSQPEDSPLTERTYDVLREEQKEVDSDLNGHSALDCTSPVCSVERVFSAEFKTQATQTLSDILLKTRKKLSASESKQPLEAFCLTDFQPKVYALLEEEEVDVTPPASPLSCRGLGIRFTFTKKVPVFRFGLKNSVYPADLVSDDHPSTSSSGNQKSSQRESKILMSPFKKTRKHLSRMFSAISKALPNPFKSMTPSS
ncbi:hypothetical protein MHYP_G00097520 [Metynnis hypsauchen]